MTLSTEPETRVFDHDLYTQQVLAAFAVRVAQVSRFLACTTLVFNNYDPLHVTAQSLPLYLSVAGMPPVLHDGQYQLAPGTEAFATQMETIGLFTAAEGCLASLIAPYSIVRHLTFAQGLARASEWELRLSRTEKELERATLGRLVQAVQAIAEALAHGQVPDVWANPLDRLARFARLRNCIAHRSGLVSEKDFDPEDDHLTVRWQGIALTVGGAPIAGAPYSSEAGEIGRTNTSFEKTWRLGDSISLSPTEVQGIAFSLLAYMHPVSAVISRGIAARVSGLDIAGPTAQ